MNTRGDRGFVLLAVLWMLAMLAALASAYSVYALNTAASVYLPQERLKVDAAISAAVELTAYRQLVWPDTGRPSQGAFAARLGAARIDVSYRAESARIDLNAAPRDVLAGLFAKVGAKSATADFLADRVVRWRKRQQEPERLAEAAIYHRAQLSYAPVGAPFDNVLELAALPEMSPQLLARALPFLTVYNSTGTIDPTIADPVVLAAIPGMTPKMESELKAAASVKPADPAALAAIVGQSMTYIGIGANDTVRAFIVVTFPERKVSAEVVVTVSGAAHAEEPFQILFWRDGFDG